MQAQVLLIAGQPMVVKDVELDATHAGEGLYRQLLTEFTAESFVSLSRAQQSFR
jgi:hypothetical protein